MPRETCRDPPGPASIHPAHRHRQRFLSRRTVYRGVLLRRQNELVSVGVLDDGRRAPRFRLRRHGEFDAASRELFVGLLDVIAVENDVGESADPILMSVRSEEHKARFGAGDAQLDPALLAVKGLVGEDDEPEFPGVEIQGLILIAYRDAGELDSFNHVRPEYAMFRGLAMS